MIRVSLPAVLSAVAALLAGACDDTVHIRLSYGSDPAMAAECDLAVKSMESFHGELMREGEELIFKKCIAVPEGLDRPGTLSELESLLQSRIAFEEVPSGGQWTIWVEGFITKSCAKAGRAPLLCGRQPEVSMPSQGEIVVSVYCVSPKNAWSAEALQSCRFQ